jgi:hypothetical protein
MPRRRQPGQSLKMFLALAAWYSGHRVCLQNRRSRVRIPSGCKVFLGIYTLQCCCHNLIWLVIVKKNIKNMFQCGQYLHTYMWPEWAECCHFWSSYLNLLEPRKHFETLFAGLPYFSWCSIPKREKIPNWSQNIPTDHSIFQMAVKYTKWPLNLLTSFFARDSEIHPNWNFLVWKYTIW